MKHKKFNESEYGFYMLTLWHVTRNISLQTFCDIYHEDGELMHKRFEEQFDRNFIKFYYDLCDIDQAKMNRYVKEQSIYASNLTNLKSTT